MSCLKFVRQFARPLCRCNESLGDNSVCFPTTGGTFQTRIIGQNEGLYNVRHLLMVP